MHQGHSSSSFCGFLIFYHFHVRLWPIAIFNYHYHLPVTGSLWWRTMSMMMFEQITAGRSPMDRTSLWTVDRSWFCLIKDTNLGCFCLWTFESAKGTKERWCRWESNPRPLAYAASTLPLSYDTHQQPPLFFACMTRSKWLCRWMHAVIRCIR